MGERKNEGGLYWFAPLAAATCTGLLKNPTQPGLYHRVGSGKPRFASYPGGFG